MPPDILTGMTGRDRLAERMPESWARALVPLAGAWAMLLLLFASDWLRIAALAWNSSTYNHIVLVPVILIWLVAQRAPQLAKIAPVAWWPGLIAAMAGGMAWVLGAFSGLDFARQLGVVLMLIATVPLLLGPRVTAGLIFPLCYALLLVPLGDEIVPLLQLITASITVFLVRASGIAAVIEGVFINTPAGLFEVAEACSGVKFLIAMMALGLLVGNVCFRSWRRRAIFFAACVIVPVLANGFRAFATIWMAQIVGVEAAVGFDHIVYGWIFFAVIVVLLLAGAWRFFDRPPTDPMIDADAINASPLLANLSAWRAPAVAALAALALLVGAAHLWARAGDALSAPIPEGLEPRAIPGWQRVTSVPALKWEPRARGAGLRQLTRYSDAKGRTVDVFLAVYASQGEGREAGGFGEGALMPGGRWSWQSHGPALGGARSEYLHGDDGETRLALTWYRTGDLTTGSNLRLKLQNMADRLLLRARPTTLLIVSAVSAKDAEAQDTARAFLEAAGPVGSWMDHAAGLR